MEPTTWLIDFSPHITKETPSQLRRKEYVEGVLNRYNLGEVSFIESVDECKRRGPAEKPDIIICTYECDARDIKKIIPESVMYVVEGLGSIYSRKAETSQKIEKNEKIFKDIAETVEQIRTATDEGREQMRKFNAMSYDEMYKMITMALISDNEDVKKQAWDLLWGPGEKNSNIIWMRVQMMAEVWEHSNGERLEQLMLMSMERHIDYGLARKIENYTDEDGLEYHQYVYIDPFGNDMEYIRKLPRAKKDQERYAYEALLEKNEIPSNYIRVQMEADQFKKEVDEYREAERIKILAVLERYKVNPNMGRKELGVASEPEKEKEPLLKKEVAYLREILKRLESLQNTN